MKKRITKSHLEAAIQELVEYAKEMDIDFSKFSKTPKKINSFDEFMFDKKLDEVLEKLTKEEDFYYYQIDKIVFDKKYEEHYLSSGLLLEWQQYKKIPRTNLVYRYDKGNTNTKTQDHIEVYQDKTKLYAINKDGTKHDGSKARLGSKEIKFLKNMGFTPPLNGILEWIQLDMKKDYVAIDFELLFG